MVIEWMQFLFGTGLLLFGMAVFVLELIGTFKFKYVLNRMHIAAAIDTLGILMIMCGLIIWQGFEISSMKLVLIILFFWISGPVSSHLIARMEVSTNEELSKECEVKELGEL